MFRFYKPVILAVSLLGGALPAAWGQAAVVSTVAGSGTAGRADGPAATAQFNQPYGVALDAQGNAYVADRLNHVIRKITAAGVVTTFAGNGTAGYGDDPVGLLAGFDMPHSVLLTPAGNLLVADTGNDCIRQISPAGAVTTFAGSFTGGYVDGPAATARFSGPIGIVQDAAGNVYVADADNFRIRRIDPAGMVSTIAGSGVRGHLDGPAATARFFEPQGITLDAAGNLYIADRAGNRIRKLTPAGVVSTYAGGATGGYLDGPAATARFNAPIGVAVDAGSGDVYVSDRDNQRLRRIEAATSLVSTVAGTGAVGNTDGPAPTARFASPRGLALHRGSLYVADLANHRIRRVSGLPLAATGARPVLPVPTLEVYPNPAAGPVAVRYHLPQAGRVSSTLIDGLGRPVARPVAEGWRSGGWHEARLTTEHLPAGLYFVQLTVTGQTLTQRLALTR